MYQDRGHYYLNGVLNSELTKAKCRDAGGIPSVTTKIDSWTDSGLMFWKIGENLEAAYAVLDKSIGLSLADFKELVAIEYYRTHNALRLGTFIHDILHQLISNGIENRLFMSFFKEYADPQIQELFESVQMAYEWYLEHFDQAQSEKILYEKDTGISGTCDLTGMLLSPDGTKIVGGADWKCTYVKKHPGYYKKDGKMKSLGIKKSNDNKMQLGAYGKVLGWEGAYIVKISTNPMVSGIQPQWYSKEELVKGYTAYAHVARAYDIFNGFVK